MRAPDPECRAWRRRRGCILRFKGLSKKVSARLREFAPSIVVRSCNLTYFSGQPCKSSFPREILSEFGDSGHNYLLFGKLISGFSYNILVVCSFTTTCLLIELKVSWNHSQRYKLLFFIDLLPGFFPSANSSTPPLHAWLASFSSERSARPPTAQNARSLNDASRSTHSSSPLHFQFNVQ